MLSRIEKITGLGLLHNSSAASIGLTKVALIYADNARGKSTLSSLMRSVGSGDTTDLRHRKTIDGTEDISALLRFNTSVAVTLSQDVWSMTRNEVAVFDTDFVDRNAYSGFLVAPRQRKNLLHFALGTAAVDASTAVEKSIDNHNDAKSRLVATERTIETHHVGISLLEFLALKKPAAYEKSRANLILRIQDASEMAKVIQTPVPPTVPCPDFDVLGILATLQRKLDDLHEDAERMVRAHTSHMPSNAEDWLTAGQQFDDHQNCPYCGQPTVGVDLISAYRSYFNVEFQSLQTAISSIRLQLNKALPTDLGTQIARQIAMDNEALTYWSSRSAVSNVQFDQGAFDALLNELRGSIDELTAAKQVAIGTWVPSIDDSGRVMRSWDGLLQKVEQVNTAIAANTAVILEYKATLNAVDIAEIRRELSLLEQAEHRHSADIAPLLTQLDGAQKGVKDSEKLKRTAQANLTKVMNETLLKYQDSTNNFLKRLGAMFKLVELKGNNHSGGNSTYAIELRGRTVQLEGVGPNFSNTLSESEKRTLALAFFCASVLDSTKAADQIVVFDDPVSSYDSARMARTVELLTEIAGTVHQLIILSHNAHFLLALDGKLEKARLERTQRTHLQIRRTEHDYSDFAKFDLEKACESEYFRNFRLLEEFRSGTPIDHSTVALAIRPTVEGYLHRRFPSELKSANTLGEVVKRIDTADKSSSLAYAKHLTTELRAINDWASQPHHATNQTSALPPDATETLDFCRRALDVIWGANDPEGPTRA